MLLKLIQPVITPRRLAAQTVEGGLLYSRCTRANRVQELINGAEYSRGVREFIPRENNRRWKTPRVQRISYPAARSVRPGRPPPQRTPKVGPSRPYPEGWGLPLDGESSVPAYWEQRFYRQPRSAGPQGTPYLEIHHRGGRRFEKWSTRISYSNCGGYKAWPVWGYQPRKEQDPLRGVYSWFFRTGLSPLGGLRGSHQGDPRGGHLNKRLGALLRRRREHHLVDVHLDRLNQYRNNLLGRRRYRLPYPQQRELLFRRRRLRGYLTGRVSHRNYVRRLTRRGFYRWHSNRWARLERSTLLGGSYFEARSLWNTYLLGSRVATPLEYNLYKPFAGFGRLVKRRRLGARRWKLGQHLLWGEPFKKFRTSRWSWFEETPLGVLIQAHRGGNPPVGKPTTGSLTGAVYWSAQKWGRSRWDRPTGREVTGFVWSLKGGTAVELESQQWGRAGTSATGVFLSLVGEYELRQGWAPPVYKALTTSPSRPAPGRVKLAPWVINLAEEAKLVFWKVTILVWSLLGPVWWIYSKVGQAFCYFGWWVRRGYFFSLALLKVIPGVMIDFLYRQITLPAWAGVTHWIKDTSLFKTVGWVWTSWILVYSSGDDQRGLDVPTVERVNETTQEYYLDEVDPNEEYPDDDDDEETTVHTGAPRLPTTESWSHNTDFAVLDMLESTSEFLLEEVPYRVGFFLQPWIDFCVRLPFWGLLEGVSLVTLAIKLEHQQAWTKLLSRGGPHQGRWWKVILIFFRAGLGFLLWIILVWLIGSSLSYSTLRLEVVLWGLPWREEYYLFWWLLIGAGVTKIVAPYGVKNFLFTEVGWANLVGLYWGSIEVAQPEEYYPGRPPSVATRVAIQTVGMPMRRQKTYDDVIIDLREDHFYLGGATNAGYDEIQLILAQKYETGDNATLEELDETNYFGFPLHLAHTLDQEVNSPYKWDYSGPPGNELRNRAWREPHLTRNNYYEVTFHNLGGRTAWPQYFDRQVQDYRPFGGTPEFSTKRHLYGQDESLTGNQTETPGE